MILYYGGVGILYIELIAYSILFLMSIGILLSAWSSNENLKYPFYIGVCIAVIIAVAFYFSPNPKLAFIGALTLLSLVGVIIGKQAASSWEKFISYCICFITVVDGIILLTYMISAN